MDRNESRNTNAQPLTVPEDNTITTLWVGGLGEGTTDAEVVFSSPFLPFPFFLPFCPVSLCRPRLVMVMVMAHFSRAPLVSFSLSSDHNALAHSHIYTTQPHTRLDTLTQSPTLTHSLIRPLAHRQVRAVFYPFGELSSVRIIEPKKCVFVTFMRRDSAEAAANKLYNTLNIKGKSCRLAWGKRQSTAGGRGPPGVRAPPGVKGGPAAAPPMYPSQDPANMAARFSTPQD